MLLGVLVFLPYRLQRVRKCVYAIMILSVRLSVPLLYYGFMSKQL